MAGRPPGTTKSKQTSLMAGLRKPVEFYDENYVFTMTHSGTGKKLLVRDCESSDEIFVPTEYLWVLKEVVDAEIKSLQKIAPPKEGLAEASPKPIPGLDDEPETETPEEIIARLEAAKATPKAATAKKP
jgi:hypothetical protein